MNRPVLLAVVAIAAAGTAYWMYLKDQVDQVDAGTDEPTFIDEALSQLSNMTINPREVLTDHNVQAFLWLVRTGEGTTGPNGYRTMYGGRLFADTTDHPRTAITAGGWTSTAAGAYQFLSRTWDEMRAKYDLPDFGPSSQDIAAVGLIKRRGALADVLAGRFNTAIDKCNKEWASLPGSPYGQPTLTLAKATQVLAAAGANFSTENLA